MAPLLAALLIAAAPPGEIAFMRDGKVWLVREDGTHERKLAEGSYDRPLVWSPDSSKLLFWKEDPTWQLFQVEPESGRTVNLTQNRLADCRAASYSPDGKRIAFMSGERGLCLIQSDGSGLRFLSTKGHRDARPFWTAGGDLLFQEIEQGRFAVLRYAMGAGLVSEVADATHFAVSPDGKRLAYMPRGREKDDLRIMDLASGRETAVFRNGHEYDGIAWDPAGRFLAALSYKPAHALWRLTPGSEPIRMASLEFDAWVGFSLSPDGKSVAFSNGHRPNEAIYVVPVSGGKGKMVAKGVWPAWRP